MDTRTGEIGNCESLMGRLVEELKSAGQTEEQARSYAGTIIKPIDPKNLSRRTRAVLEKSGRAFVTRNSKCPCGSGKRFKRCCQRLED